VDCGNLVLDLRRRIESGENLDLISADLEYGVMAELDEFARRILILLTRNLEGMDMVDTYTNGLSTGSQQAKNTSLLIFLTNTESQES
jgi:hypothetical protein